ncbi:conserved hypothetical protein, partial [Trichinella spiralis]|uniref:hypothetical protein n=1 Tax=Trichinella spiralis TaxID=6334 RepID=UPI0001EFD599
VPYYPYLSNRTQQPRFLERSWVDGVSHHVFSLVQFQRLFTHPDNLLNPTNASLSQVGYWSRNILPLCTFRKRLGYHRVIPLSA